MICRAQIHGDFRELEGRVLVGRFEDAFEDVVSPFYCVRDQKRRED